jgi:MFS family permease
MIRIRNSPYDDDDDLTLTGFLGVFRQPRLLPWCATTVINMFLVGILFGFLPVRLHTLDYTPLASGVLLTIVSAAYVAIQPLAGWLADRADTAMTIRIGLAVAATATIAMALTSGPLLIAAAIAAGLGVGVVWTNTDTLISTLAATGQLGATMGAAGSFKELGDMTGPLLVGLLSQAFGLTTGFLICGILALACVPLLRRVRCPPRSPGLGGLRCPRWTDSTVLPSSLEAAGPFIVPPRPCQEVRVTRILDCLCGNSSQSSMNFAASPCPSAKAIRVSVR